MARFRKKPLEVDAIQVREIFALARDAGGNLDSSDTAPSWLLDAHQVDPETDEGHGGYPRLMILAGEEVQVITRQGQAVCAAADEWIVRAANNDLWPVHPDIFEAIYEPAAATPDTPDEAWVGTEPGEGTRRRVILDVLVDRLPDAHRLTLIEMADSIEIALQSAAEQPEAP